MRRDCQNCQKAFEITESDLQFYDRISPVFADKKFSIPPPTHCSDCRQQRRLSWRNERHLHHRKCDLTGRQIISMYTPDKPFPVYDQEAWWSDKWDAFEYGQDFDFSRLFFEQFSELLQKVPRISLINKEHQNSEYCNFGWRNKNCYLLFTSQAEDSFYSNRSFGRNLCDCSSVVDCELCYEAVDSRNCYHCLWIQNCVECNNCTLGYGLQSCQDCFACYGLVQKKYCIGNIQFSKDEYFNRLSELKKDFSAVRKNYETHLQNSVHRSMTSLNAHECTGDAIFHSKNAQRCFEVQNLEDCKFVCNARDLKDVYDLNNGDHSELLYEVIGDEENYHNLFCDICWFNHELLYSSLCFHSQNLFGCIGMKRAKYCILNKQYSQEEYEKLVPKIIEHMQQTPSASSGLGGEWGEFFPIIFSPFGYNETMAQDYFPISQSEAKKRDWKWQEEEKSGTSYLGPKAELPQDVHKADESLCSQIFLCTVTNKPYKITPQELQFYKKMDIPLPRKCPEERHKERLALRNPRKLWQRNCAKCGKEIQTTYAPNRPEVVYCEECYLQTVY